jgi:hypothetical protein
VGMEGVRKRNGNKRKKRVRNRGKELGIWR